MAHSHILLLQRLNANSNNMVQCNFFIPKMTQIPLPPSINPTSIDPPPPLQTKMTISSPPHFVIFPFMSQGHTTPLLYLSRILSDRGIIVTVITTTANFSSVKATMKSDSISVIDIPFQDHIPSILPGIEITDKLPCMGSFIRFVESTQHLQTRFEEVVQSLPKVTCIISDGFLIWTQDSADKLGIPRLIFYGNNIFSMTMCNIMAQFKPHAEVGPDESFSMPGFPRFKLTANDFDQPFSLVDMKGPTLEFLKRQQTAMARSRGMVVNSFYELEPEFNDYWNKNYGPKAWLVGPFCVAKPPPAPVVESQGFSIKLAEKPTWIRWLDAKLVANEPVLYVSFGSQAEASAEQLHEVANGLERSNMSFLWVVKPKQLQVIGAGFEKGRGKVVAEWVDQVEILNHEVVCGFLSHCGWNSMLEAMCAGVAVLAMPLMAEQHLNARLVVEEIGMGLRLWPKDMVARGMVGAEEVAKMVVELMEGDGGKRVRKRVKEVREAANDAMKDGGSSSLMLDSLIDHVCGDVRSTF